MDDCFETAVLQRWLNGNTDNALSDQIASHIQSCMDCQQRLSDLTDDDSILPPKGGSTPPSDHTFTNEPHFASLQKQLGESVKRLVRAQNLQPQKDTAESISDGDINNQLQASQFETVVSSDSPTVISDAESDSDDELNVAIYQTPLEATPPGAPILIDGFRLDRLIGKGGFARVYQAWDKSLTRSVAVKILDRDRVDARGRRRFSREAKTASSIVSPYVINILSCGETANRQPFIAMELIEGGSLSDWIRAELEENQLGLTAIRKGVELVIQASRGAEAVHEAGLIHRDIKPGNIFVDQDISKLGDFGLARMLDGDTVTLTRAAETTGTPAYMSPEQAGFASEVDARSDVYSLGATLYHVLTGQTPFRGSSMAILKQVADVEPVSPRQMNELVSQDLETICLKAMSKLPEHRYQSAGGFADDLQRFIDGQPIIARPVPAWRRLIMWRDRNLALANTLSLLLMALVLGTASTTMMWMKSSRNAEEALRYAASLEDNRGRLRDSVSRFQKRIFSDQAMHWQMPESFRAEMFTDVISYLDEFAELETPQNASDTQMNNLTKDYLLIAEAALDVNRYQDAQVASDRALKRLREFSDGDQKHHLKYRTARLGYLAKTPSTRFFDLARANAFQQTERQELALLCHTAIQHIGQSVDTIWKIRKLEAAFLVIASKKNLGDRGFVDAVALFEKLIESLDDEQDHKIRLEAIETALSIGWFLADVSVDSKKSIEVIEENVVMIESMRESLRHLAKSLTCSDWHKARNYARLAVLKHKVGDIEGAIESAVEAEHAFRKAVQMRPHHRIWTDDMICLQLLLTDWLVGEGKLGRAKETITDAVMYNIRLAKTYPSDFGIQKRTVKIFVKLAEVAEKRKMYGEARHAYYIAARDCQLIMLQEEHRDWAFESRRWLVSKTLKQLDLAPDGDIRAGIIKNENSMIKGWRDRAESETFVMQAVLDGEHHPDRPAYLEFARITEDILAEN